MEDWIKLIIEHLDPPSELPCPDERFAVVSHGVNVQRN